MLQTEWNTFCPVPLRGGGIKTYKYNIILTRAVLVKQNGLWRTTEERFPINSLPPTLTDKAWNHVPASIVGTMVIEYLSLWFENLTIDLQHWPMTVNAMCPCCQFWGNNFHLDWYMLEFYIQYTLLKCSYLTFNLWSIFTQL